jgi:CheY-like chemotaxis protein
MNVRILIVEDEDESYGYISDILSTLRHDDFVKLGMSTIEVTRAASVEGAIAQLNGAAASHRPFDIMLLDLALPRQDEQKFVAGLKVGLEVLKDAQSKQSVRSVIALTMYNQFILEAFRDGVNDFVDKNGMEKTLPERLALCWQAVVRSESERAFARRLRVLMPYAEQGLVYLFNTIFSKLSQSVAIGVRDIGDQLHDRFGLEWGQRVLESTEDIDDPLLAQLARLMRDNSTAQRRWRDNMASMLVVDAVELADVDLQETFFNLKAEVEYAFLQKRVELVMGNFDGIRVRAFKSDFVTIIREITLGTIADIREPAPNEDARRVSISLESKPASGPVEVLWSDNFRNYDAREANAINSNWILKADERFGRSWGLSIAQHIAVRSEWSISIDVNSPTSGTKVKFIVPRLLK